MTFLAKKEVKECEEKIFKILVSYNFNTEVAKYILRNTLENIDHYSYINLLVKSNDDQQSIH